MFKKLSIGLFLLLLVGSLHAGGTACTSADSGNWSNTLTWNCTGGSGIPEFDTTVTINNGHTVLLDTSSTIATLVVFAGGDLDVGDSGGPVNLVLMQPGNDLTEADIDLVGDVVITTTVDLILGQMDGAHGVTLNGAGSVTIQEPIGGVVPLTHFESGADLSLNIQNDISSSAAQSFLGDVVIDGSVTLNAVDLLFDGPLNAEPIALSSDLTLNHTGSAQINDHVGSVIPLSSLTTFQEVSLMADVGSATVTTTGSQSFSQLTIESDAVLTSTGAGVITIAGSSGPHDLTVNTSGNTFFSGTIGSTRHSSITTDTGGNVRLSGVVTFQVDGSDPTTFNDTLSIGASGRVTIDQAGSGDVVFNGSVARLSGGAHELIVNDVSGRTVFNNTVLIGELTTNDGAGDDVTVINTNSIVTRQAGADNGRMRFNDPVEVMQSVTFSEISGGSIQFMNTLNKAQSAGSVDININSDATVILSAVGDITSPTNLTTDVGGSVAIIGDVLLTGNLTFNDPITLNTAATLSGETVLFNDTVDMQSHNLTLFALSAQANGVISGTGNLISDVISTLSLTAENDYTGQTLINNGVLSLEDAVSDNNISTSSHIYLSEFAVINPNDSTFTFQLAEGQTLTGSGSINNQLIADVGSFVSPGTSPGRLSAQSFGMNSGSQLNIEINGTTAATEYDQINTTLANLDYDAQGGADLVVELNFTPDFSDEFTIINNPTNDAVLGTFNGIAEGGHVTTSNGQSLAVSYTGGDGNDVVLSGACQMNITVTDNGNDGPGTLRQALFDVCDGGSIGFAGDMTITVLSRIPTIDKTVSISAVGQQVILSGGNTTGIMAVGNAGNVALNTLTFTEGRASTSGAISNSGSLTVLNSTFSNNTAEDLSVSGGAIYSNPLSDLLYIENSTFVSNSGELGGAIYNSSDDFTAVNSTFTLNGLNAAEGAAIYNIGDDMTLVNVTIAANGGVNTVGAGIYSREGSHALINTLVADSPSGSDCFYETANSSENNINSLIESGNCDAALTEDPQLQSLADNGGNTQTMALALSSPAVDAGDNTACPDFDQRGVERVQLAACDIGAYETEHLAIIYVDRDNINRSGTCIPGACWGNAHEHLNDALEAAGPTSQIWVADGVYYPDLGAGMVNDDSQSSFVVPANVHLFGGFNGSEDSLDQRDVNVNVTILSGDIDQNDVNDDGNQVAETVADINGINAFNVVSINGSGVTVDGFTVTAGYANGVTPAEQSGGGLRCLQAESDAHVFNSNTWLGNYAVSNGGAIDVCGGQVMNSLFSGNESNANGGAIFSIGNVVIDNSQFQQNHAAFGGGAVFAASTTMDRVVMQGNQADLYGGALFINGDIEISNSLFSGNYSNDSGGAIITFNNTHFTNVTMTGNRAFNAGGAVFIPDSPNRVMGNAEFTFQNSIVWNNQDGTGTGTISAGVTSTDAVLFAHTVFQGSGGSSQWNPGAGIDGGNNIDLDPDFVMDVDLMAVPTITGNARLLLGSAAIGTGDNGAVQNNQDLDGNDRFDGGTVDMGAYEYNDLIFANGFD